MPQLLSTAESTYCRLLKKKSNASFWIKISGLSTSEDLNPPMPAGFFSSKRKTGNSGQYKTTKILTNGPSLTNILSPSYQNWFTKYLGNNGSQNSMLDGGTIICALKKGTNGKQHLKPAMACSNQQLYSLGWQTPWQYSKPWWTMIWKRRSTKGTLQYIWMISSSIPMEHSKSMNDAWRHT